MFFSPHKQHWFDFLFQEHGVKILSLTAVQTQSIQNFGFSILVSTRNRTNMIRVLNPGIDVMMVASFYWCIFSSKNLKILGRSISYGASFPVSVATMTAQTPGLA